MTKCMICNKVVSGDLLCKSCNKNPVNIEILRNFYAKNEDLLNFKKTYSGRYSEIPNKNSSFFWNNKFSSIIENAFGNGIDPMTQDKINDVIVWMKNSEGRLLDIGVGLGQLEEKLTIKNKKISFYGVDTSNYAIDWVKKRVSGKFYNSSIFDKEFDKEFFDIIICLEFLEHVSPQNTLSLLKKINKMLKVNGLLIISVPLNEGLEEMLKNNVNPNSHVRIYFPSVINTELCLSGFNIVNTKCYFAFRNMYKIKSFISNYIFKNLKKPNNVLIMSKKV